MDLSLSHLKLHKYVGISLVFRSTLFPQIHVKTAIPGLCTVPSILILGLFAF